MPNHNHKQITTKPNPKNQLTTPTQESRIIIHNHNSRSLRKPENTNLARTRVAPRITNKNQPPNHSPRLKNQTTTPLNHPTIIHIVQSTQQCEAPRSYTTNHPRPTLPSCPQNTQTKSRHNHTPNQNTYQTNAPQEITIKHEQQTMITRTQQPTPSPTTPTHKEEQIIISMLLKITTIIQSNINPHSNHNETLPPHDLPIHNHNHANSTTTLSPPQSLESQYHDHHPTSPLHTNHQKMKQQHNITNHPTTNDIEIKSTT